LQLGIPPARIDILAGITGVDFNTQWPRRLILPMAGMDVPVLSKADFIINKTLTNRPKDRIDLELLKEADEPS
jgi:hypothetical protein